MNPRTLLRIEGLLVAGVATAVYGILGHSPLLFLALLLAPDLSMAGYLHSRRVGAVSYNAVHTYLAPGLLALGGIVASADLAIAIALIRIAHIGGDRLFGFGLKYGTQAFGETHIQRL